MTARTATSRSLALANESGRDWDSMQFHFIFALSFVFYLVTAIAARLTPQHWRNAASPHRSIFAQAKEAAGTTAQIAFYG